MVGNICSLRQCSAFFVDGKTIPLVDFDIGPSWAGLLPISGARNETRQLFFWFFPPGPGGSLDDLLFWTNGGPGCSSLEGLLQENGPFSWAPGTAKPIVNEFSWTNLSSVLFVEQPVGTGYSQGTPNITNEVELSAQLFGFFQQFLEVFSELKGKKFYLSGESYAGTYIPYIADYIYSHKSQLDLDLQGFWISDPSVSSDVVLEQIPAVDFVHKYEHVFSFNQSFMAHLDQVAQQCGYAGYIQKFVTFPPPPAPFPIPPRSNTSQCDVWDLIFDAALLVNPAFNIYRIFDTFPVLWDVLGFPGSFPEAQTLPLYFDRSDVKKVLHAPQNVDWAECSEIDVFVKGNDRSLPPAFTVLPGVIEKNKRTVIVHGLGDFILMADGTRITIQNMTWNGAQGFRTPIKNDSFVVNGMGAMGTAHNERGLTFYEVVLSGHMVPQFSPRAGFRIMQYLMGFKSTISD